MPTIEIAQPVAQFTPGAPYALVQFSWRTAAVTADPAATPPVVAVPVGNWHCESYSPTQDQLSARADPTVLAVAPGYWADAEVRADVLAWTAVQYGFTDMTFLT